MKKILLLTFIWGFVYNGFAQNNLTVSDVKSDKSYLWGEGRSTSLSSADASALDDLISQISINVESNFDQNVVNVVQGEMADTKEVINSVVKTYSSATLSNTKRFVTREKEGYCVTRYVKKSEVHRIFELRKFKIKDMVKQAVSAQNNREIDNALRNYYWAYCLLQSLPVPSEVTDTIEGTDRMLVTWIPRQIRSIFSKLKISTADAVDGMIDLVINYEGKPVSSLDYSYFDGMTWSNIYSAKDGRGFIELGYDVTPENLQILCEYEYRAETHIDKEIEKVVELMKGIAFNDAHIIVNSLKEEEHKQQPTIAAEEKNTTKQTIVTDPYSFSAITAGMDFTTIATNTEAYSSVTLMEGAAVKPYESKMSDIIQAISEKNYDKVQGMFTPEGWDMFSKLISHGDARLMGKTEISFLQADDNVVCRSVPMTFSYKNNMRKFVEDVTFTFNEQKQIEAVAFGLGYEACNDIWSHEEWTLASRLFLITFLENYKTAYALKRIDYIASIFDDNAVIITGTMTSRITDDVEANKYKNEKVVRYNRQTKDQYIKNLRRCFDGNEFINIRFGENRVIKAAAGGELFSLQIKQDYYSTNYGDQGYLFLMVDLNQQEKPIIKVRTWQPEKDPNFGVIGLEHFN